MIKKILKKGHFILAAGLLALGTYFFMPSPTASAQGIPPGEQVDNMLERGLERLQNVSQHLQERLDKTAVIVTKGEEWIEKLQAEGVDTAVLEDALATYQDQAAAAQALTDSGRQILDEHVGFDDNGSVINRKEAATTLRDAARNLRDSHRQLREATMELRRIVTDFRRDLRGNE